jgi:YceI-like domain
MVDDGDRVPEMRLSTLALDEVANNTDRDQHLGSDHFCAVGTYPTITFDSSRIVKKTAETFNVTGTLTIRGVAREVTLRSRLSERRRIHGATPRRDSRPSSRSIGRTSGRCGTPPSRPADFLVGDDVRISVSIQAIAEPERG